MSLLTDLIDRHTRIDPPDPGQNAQPDRWHTRMADSMKESRGFRGLLDLLFQQLRDHRDDPRQEPINVDKALSILTERNDKPALLPNVVPDPNIRAQILESLAARCLDEICARRKNRTLRRSPSAWPGPGGACGTRVGRLLPHQ